MKKDTVHGYQILSTLKCLNILKNMKTGVLYTVVLILSVTFVTPAVTHIDKRWSWNKKEEMFSAIDKMLSKFSFIRKQSI